MNVLGERVADDSVQNIFINHPEPPQQRGRQDGGVKADTY